MKRRGDSLPLHCNPASWNLWHMRIAIYSEIYWPMVSGVALTLRRLVDALHARGHAVRVYSPHYDLPPGCGRATRGAPVAGAAVLPRARRAVGLPEGARPRRRHAGVPAAGGSPGHRVRHGLSGASRVEGSSGLPIIASSHTDYEAYARPYGRWLVHSGAAWMGLPALVLPACAQGALPHAGARGASPRPRRAPHRHLDARRQLGGVPSAVSLRRMARAVRHRSDRHAGDLRGPHRAGEEPQHPARCLAAARPGARQRAARAGG